MRVIKFRYYDKKNKLMWNVGSIDFSNNFVQLRSDGNQFVNDCLHCGEETNCYSPFKVIELLDLIQFTGLLDKNGKEIWEGDILGDYEDEAWVCYGSVSFYDYNATYMLVGVDGYSTDYESYDDSDWDKLEIIGNIYENPELLAGVE